MENKKNNFTVTNLSLVFKLSLFLIMAFLVLNVIVTITTAPPHLAMYICTSVIVYIPCILAILWAKVFKITVKGKQITVRRMTGLKYRFDISEVVQVDWKVVETAMGINESIIIRTSSRKLSIGTFMDGSDRMREYILENVDHDKINTTEKSIKKVF